MGYLNKEGKAQFKEPRFKSPKSTIEQSKDEKWSWWHVKRLYFTTRKKPHATKEWRALISQSASHRVVATLRIMEGFLHVRLLTFYLWDNYQALEENNAPTGKITSVKPNLAAYRCCRCRHASRCFHCCCGSERGRGRLVFQRRDAWTWKRFQPWNKSGRRKYLSQGRGSALFFYVGMPINNRSLDNDLLKGCWFDLIVSAG